MEDAVVEVSAPLIDVDEPATPAPAAEEQKANAAPASEADDQNPEAVTETPEQQEAKRESRRARSNARKAAALAAAQTEARMLREQLARFQQPAPQPDSGEPKREQYQDYESYLEARAEWRADQKVQAALKSERESRQSSEQQSRAAAGQVETAKAWIEREKAFQAETKDYDAVVAPFAEDEDGLGRFSDVARRAIVDSEVGPQVLYHLATNPDDAERIADLSPHRQAVELGKLEAKLSSAPKKQVSNAPPPVKPVGQGRSAGNGFHENMSDAEYRDWRKKTGARWAQ